ncbi:MAG: carboxypeptidase-like regulatory domain-containing protein, partial [Gemmatimonadaceae bacterium]
MRDSVSGLVVPGAVISAFDSAGHPGLRTISDETGRFTLDVAPGPARLRVIRLGFEPRSVAVPPTAQERAAGLEVRMLALPALLTQVHVSDHAICPGNADRSGALGLWEQARAGLLAAVVARQSKPGNIT